MNTLTPIRQPSVVKFRVYHCGNFLGLWAEGAEWYCRKCRRLIDSIEARA